jgi:hypothetical protein
MSPLSFSPLSFSPLSFRRGAGGEDKAGGEDCALRAVNGERKTANGKMLFIVS